MDRTARSLRVFGIYLVALGGVLMGSPNTLLSLVRLPPTSEPWIHVLGIPVMGMGLMFMANARAAHPVFVRVTLWLRVYSVVAFATLAIVRIVPPIVVAFGAIDLAGAAWTWATLRSASS